MSSRVLTYMKPNPSRSGTSDLTHLIIYASAPYENDLSQILSWPKALQSFILRPIPKKIRGRTIYVPSIQLTDILQPHRDSLKEFLIMSEPGSLISGYKCTAKLKTFSALEFLGLPLSFASDISTLNECLPPKLKVVQIEKCVHVETREIHNEAIDETALQTEFRTLNAWLEELESFQTAGLLNLEALRIWLIPFEQFRANQSTAKAVQERMLERMENFFRDSGTTIPRFCTREAQIWRHPNPWMTN